MIKLLYNDGQDDLLKAAGALSTLIECDRHIKSARSSAVSEEMIRNHLPDKEHFAQHLIAMGAAESYGYNRNGDAFSKQALADNHHTFVTNGHFFREHKNSDPKEAIGKVVASCFNAPMNRVELIVHGHKKKAAKEYERAKSGKPSSYSMSCRVPFDKCSCCGNEAKRSSAYCDDLKNHMGQYRKEFKKFAFAWNPNPTFFDISDVANPADRIAHFLETRFNDDEMAKAASVSGLFFSDQLATNAGVIIPDDTLGCVDPKHQTCLTKLAAIEQYVELALKDAVPKDARYHFVKEAAVFSFQPNAYSEFDIEQLRQIEPDRLLTGLAKRGAVLSFKPFCAYALGMTLKQVNEDPVVKRASSMLPELFRSLAESPADSGIEDLFSPDMSTSGCREADPIESLMDKVGDRGTIFGGPAKQRIMMIVSERGCNPHMICQIAKQASAQPEVDAKAKNLAKTYGLYKVAFCAAVEQSLNKTIDDTAAMLILFNHLINE